MFSVKGENKFKGTKKNLLYQENKITTKLKEFTVCRFYTILLQNFL